MSWTNLKTDYKNIMWNGLRKYQLIDNQDGTLSFLDVTEYLNTEDANLLADGVNRSNDTVNKIMNGQYFYFEDEVDTKLSTKQNVLTFDDVPTANSNNPVKSQGIKSALDAVNTRIDNLHVFSIHVCGNGEYDPVTGQPTIQNPDPTTFYLVPAGTAPDVFTEWVYVNNAWELFGSAQVDLSNYVTIDDLDDALADKQDLLTFDNVPVDGSDNPVKSGGLYTALGGKSDSNHNHDDRYYTESEINALLSGKSDTSHNHDDRYYTESEVNTLLAGKRDVSESYSATEVDTLLSGKSDNTHNHDGRYYTESEMNTFLAGKSDVGHTHDDRYYTESEVDTLLSAKADSADLGDLAEKDSVDWDTDIDNIPQSFPPSAHTHDDRYYTESEMDTLLSAKANTADLGNLAAKDNVDWDTDITDIPSTFPPSSHTHDDRYYTESEIDTLLSAKANTADLGTLASQNTVDWDTDITDIPSTFPPSAHTHDDRYYTETEVDTELAKKVSKSGDTMTGDLEIKKTSTAINLTNPDMDVAGSTFSGTPTASIYYRDKNDKMVGRLMLYQNSAGRSTLSLLSRHVVNGSNVDNALTLNVAADGTRTVAVTSGTESAWRDAIGLGDSGWIAATPVADSGVDRYSGTIYYRKIGQLLEVTGHNIKLSSELAANSSIALFVLPSGYRTTQYKEFYIPCYANGGSLQNRCISIRVSYAGQVYIYANNEAISTSINLRFGGTGFI